MSFQQGLSGLNAASKNLEVIGNNVANANTYGAKISRAEFSDVYAAALSGAGTNAIGIGTNLAAVAQQFTQGNITTTSNPMDLAINGAGFFQVTDGQSPISYTRNGQFKVDRDGFIVNNAGQRLVGYAADGIGQILPGQASAIQLPTGGIEPNPTTFIDLEMNLDSREGITATGATPAIQFTDGDTYNDATSQTLYDAQGQEVVLTYYFQKTAANTWDVYATANGNTIGGTEADPLPIATLEFNESGAELISPSGPITLDVPATTADDGSTSLAISGIDLDLSDATQFASPFGVTDAMQDGFSAGLLTSIAIEPNGIVSARYSNGQSRPAGQVEIATFRNPQGLQPTGDNAWARTYASGDPVVGVPGEGSLGVLQSGALEESNVDITGELVNMITAQRVYQANAQSIKTIDQVLQTIVNLR